MNKHYKLIGLTGLARSGKDTTANYLIENEDFKGYAFASPMKEACKAIFGWNDSHVNGHLKEAVDPVFGVSPRKALQTLGTDWGREMINNKIWLIRAEKEILTRNGNLVITDVRFNNEAELIKKHDGIIIKIVRDNNQAINKHKSESGIDSQLIDLVLNNNGSINKLHISIKRLLTKS